jgi:DnaJ family protein C protein 17
MGDNNRDLEELAKTTTEDFYELLGVAFDTPEADIKRAYRKSSLRYHPDKNPGDQAAADRFIVLGHARDILLDAKLKGEYDRVRLRKKEKALQDDLLDSKRRKMKEDLERREGEGLARMGSLKRKRAEDMNEKERREAEIQRLAEDGKRRRKEHQEKLQRQREEEDASFMEPSPEVRKPSKPGETAEMDRTVKVLFSRDGQGATWDKEKVSKMFEKYGKVEHVVMGKDKKIKVGGEKHRKVVAIVFIVYTRVDHAHAAVLDAKSDYPALESVTWAGKEPEIKPPNDGGFSMPSTPQATPNKTFRASFHSSNFGQSFGGAPGTPSFSFSPKTPSLEETTMMRLKLAEKKRLEEQIRQQEAAEDKAV